MTDVRIDTPRVLAAERRRLRRLRMIVDLTTNLIRSDLTLSAREARGLVSCARKAILELFPGYEAKYEMLIAPRFDRVLAERWPDEHTATGTAEMVN
jgi:hypothetical protein